MTALRPVYLGALVGAFAALIAGPAVAQSAPTPQGELLSAQTAGPALVANPPRGETALAGAVRITGTANIDGVLDEAFWSTIDPITNFVQRDPVDGGVPSERTEMRIAYDENNLYFGFTLHDSDTDGIRANILHRGGRIGFDDHIVIGLDTFDDRRNGYIFEMNSFGTQDDALFTDESIQDWNWDGVYYSEGRISDEGWTLEVAIPFKTIRFPRADVLEMGLLVYRRIPRKNESIFWPHLPATYRGHYAQASQYGTLRGIEGVAPGRNIQVKPFLLGGQTTGSTITTDRVLDAGLDVKYAVTSSLTLDL
ncbi:MAG: carbohydrate binding family 9 domain-containing protein, partial [Gemmatimonadota bacterium]